MLAFPVAMAVIFAGLFIGPPALALWIQKRRGYGLRGRFVVLVGIALCLGAALAIPIVYINRETCELMVAMNHDTKFSCLPNGPLIYLGVLFVGWWCGMFLLDIEREKERVARQ